jgi:hypothetical protein
MGKAAHHQQGLPAMREGFPLCGDEQAKEVRPVRSRPAANNEMH